MTMMNYDALSVDELWRLHQTVCETLAARLERDKSLIQGRLEQLRSCHSDENIRKPYPKVAAKYRDPDHPNVTWSGRGIRPHWVREYLATGASIDSLLIANEKAATT